MPRVAKELSALEVKRLQNTAAGRNALYAVGGVAGLMLQITPKGGRSWLLRVSVGGRRREIGLGSYPELPLAEARARARETKDKIRNGIDPVEERKSARASLVAARRMGLTFEEATDRYLAKKLTEFKNPKHKQQWENTLRTYAFPVIGKTPVNEITVQSVLQILEPIWASKTETASRLRGRIEAVLSWATVAGHRKGDNPARWAGNLKELLPAPSKIAKKENHPALQIGDAPRWFAALRGRGGVRAVALEFAVLTAARSEEVREATWQEVDMATGLWTRPAERMKTEREHRIPLSHQAMALLQKLPRMVGTSLIFPAPRGGVLSDATLSSAMKALHAADLKAGGTGFFDRVSKRPAVPHGLRSTFRDWVSERTHFPGEMAEIALSHAIDNKSEAAYRRLDMIEKRRAMMDAWAAYLSGQEPSGNVVDMVQARG